MVASSHYGEVEIGFERLLKDPAVDRLKRVTLANIPKSLCRTSSEVTRFEHSVGVCHLAGLVNAEDRDRKLLRVSALLHDIGIPCFSHIGERVMEKLYGIDHETRGAEMTSSGDIAEILSDIGVEPSEVGAVLKKNHYLSPLIAGSMDLDNLDNVALYWGSRGKPIRYSPERIASLFSVGDDGVIFSGTADDVLGWRKTRHELYASLNTLERRKREVMLMHALDICAEKEPDIVFMDNQQAVKVMEDNTGPSAILDRLRKGLLYRRVVFEYVPLQDKAKLERELADRYPGCVVKIDHLKFDRDIEFLNADGEIISFPRVYQDRMRAGVYKP